MGETTKVMAPECRCKEGDLDSTGLCGVHVSCDEMCGALLKPETPEDLVAAYRHWRGHSWLGGCAHGC